MRSRLDKEAILAYLKELKPDLKSEGISKIGLFGSFADEKADIASDVDIVICTTDEFKKNHPNFQAFIYLDELRKKMQREFGSVIDLCDESGLKNRDVLKGAIYV